MAANFFGPAAILFSPVTWTGPGGWEMLLLNSDSDRV